MLGQVVYQRDGKGTKVVRAPLHGVPVLRVALDPEGFWARRRAGRAARRLVRQGCFRMGLYWQGLTHDLSKYARVEFSTGVRYYQGTRSPNTAEREEKGWSEAWMHHKGRNRHHWEYWTDLDMKTKAYAPVPMPQKYLAEMVADRIAACKTYQGPAYTDASALAYFERSNEAHLMHADTIRELRFLLTMLKDQGEDETFRFMKRRLKSKTPFCEKVPIGAAGQNP